MIQSYQENVSVEDLPRNAIHNLLTKTTLLTLHHTYRQHYTPIVNIVLSELDNQLKGKELNEKNVAILMSVMTMFVTVRKGSRVEDFKPIVVRLQEVTKTVFNVKSYSNFLYSQVLRAVTGTLFHGSLEIVVSGGRVILETLNAFEDIELIYGFYLSLAKLGWPNYTQICLPYIIKYSSSYFQGHSFETILFLSEILSTNALVLNAGHLSSSLTADGLLRFPAADINQKSMVEGILDIMNTGYDWAKERDILNATDMKVNWKCKCKKAKKLI